MPTTTTNFSLLKPLVNDTTDEDLWGGYLNTNFDTLDGLVKVARDSIHRDITTTDSVIASDRNKALLCDATAGIFTLTLLAAATAGDGFKVVVVKSDSTGNAVTIDGNGGETISGAATYDLTGQGDAVTLICDGTNWFISGAKTTPSGVPSASTTVQGIVELATDAELQTGTDSSRAVVPANVKAALGFTKFFESSQLPLADTVSTAHGLGAVPKMIEYFIVCNTTDMGYDVSDIVSLATTTATSTVGVTCGYNNTNLFFGCKRIFILNKTTGAAADINRANWRLVFRAWA